MPQHQVVPPALANPCIDLYRNTYSQSDDPNVQNSYSHTFSFNAHELQQWITDVINLTKTDNIEIRLAMYTQQMIETYPQLAGKEGRVTAFLYPSDNSNQTPTSNPPEGAFNMVDPMP